MLEFRKYHGLGNDFVVIEGSAPTVSTAEVVALCDRHRGVGADGVLVIEPIAGSRLAMVIYNRDGSRPEMCGNGVRCVAAYAVRHWGFDPDDIVIKSDADTHRCIVDGVDDRTWEVTVDMGEIREVSTSKPLSVDERRFRYVFVDMGNPHAVIFDDPSVAVVDQVGAQANAGDSRFPDGINVEFAHPVDTDSGVHYEAVVYERGVGRTRACGTGACAVAVAAWKTGRVDEATPMTVSLPGGALTIEMRDGRVWMTGPTVEVFSGRW